MVQWLTLCLPMEGVWVLSLVRELRSHMPRSQKQTNKQPTPIKQKQYCNKFNKDLKKNGPHQKKILKKNQKKPWISSHHFLPSKSSTVMATVMIQDVCDIIKDNLSPNVPLKFQRKLVSMPSDEVVTFCAMFLHSAVQFPPWLRSLSGSLLYPWSTGLPKLQGAHLKLSRQLPWNNSPQIWD